MRTALVFACLLFAACNNQSQAPLVASNIVLNTPLPGQRMSAGYLSLQNNTPNDIVVTEVTSDNFAHVEIHESLLEDGISKMRRVAVLTIAANSSVELQPGGLHLMMMQPANLDDSVSLNFLSSGAVVLNISSNLSSRRH